MKWKFLAIVTMWKLRCIAPLQSYLCFTCKRTNTHTHTEFTFQDLFASALLHCRFVGWLLTLCYWYSAVVLLHSQFHDAYTKVTYFTTPIALQYKQQNMVVSSAYIESMALILYEERVIKLLSVLAFKWCFWFLHCYTPHSTITAQSEMAYI